MTPETRLPPPSLQLRRWRELDARRPHALRLNEAERAEFDRLDRARDLRNMRRL